MSNHDLKIATKEGRTILAVRVSPRARKNQIAGVLSDGRVKIRLVAPPADGKANAALVTILAETLGIPSSQVEIISGVTSRDKLVAIGGVDVQSLRRRIHKAADEGE
jgi:uncharacterized protein (TIGR00251 family)